MKSMLWKELRENWKWAGLGFLVLVLAEFYALSGQRHAQDYSSPTLCGAGFLLISAFGSAAIAAGLATVQILPELRRDQWAALLHRPVSRSTLFAGKALAGLLLYFCDTALPFLLSTAFVATPGEFAAPLVPGMLRPGLSDIAFGPVVYFGAFLLCLHRGRWFGSRGAISLALAVMFLLHCTVGWPFLLPFCCLTVFLLAAWGAMLGNGRVDSRARVAWVAYVFLVLAGLETVLFLFIFALTLLPFRQVEPPATYTRFAITQDEQILLTTTKYKGNVQTEQAVTDLQGKPVTDARYTGNNNYQEFCQLFPLVWQLGQTSSLSDTYNAGHPRSALNYVQQVTYNQGQEEWYHLKRDNYLVGYSKLSRRCIGIFDADGFKPSGATPRPFAAPLQTAIMFSLEPQLCWSGSQLYGLRFPERREVTIHLPGETIYGAVRLGSYLQEQPAAVAVALAKDIRILDGHGALICSLPYPHDPKIWPSLSMTTNPAATRFYLQSEAAFPLLVRAGNNRTAEPAFLDEADRQGNILHTYSIPTTLVASTPSGWALNTYFWTSLVPALTGALAIRHGYDLSDTSLLNVFLSAESALTWATAGIYLLLAGLGWAILAWFWGRRNGLSAQRAGFWSIFVFCFGLPGLLTFRLTQDWSPRVLCPQCGHKRPVGIAACPFCHQPWQSAPANGTEIFDLSR